ncbi:hypothetical protein [Seonamhaeicola marinus]|uniref:Uncharacterized protein n=1 Tax=Seonamhaeicola marinus TaxID=1912246 RepID=A0A5D0IUH9_9FLAO|nr:hypothetical protein [Seonamhaeicola marinus]TYA86811.1 hypothetical protein FUA24_04605 [Seonamhaeicola marinus]
MEEAERQCIAFEKDEARKRAEALKEQRRLDSIAKVEEAERQRIAFEKEEARKRAEALKEQRRLDSIAKVEEAERKRIAFEKEQARKRVEALKEQKRLDSIAKAQEVERRRIALEKKQAKEREEALKKEQRRLDSIAEALDYERRRIAFEKAQEEKRKRALREQKRLDSIAKANAKPVLNEEELAYRNKCHYQINEYDSFSRTRIIRTEPYNINKNLTIELYKQGSKLDVFINSSVDLGCVSYLSNNRSSVKVTLENNRSVTFYHYWDVECGEYLFKGRLKQSHITILKQSPIKSVLLKGTKGTLEIDNIEYKAFFMDKLKCIE